ncbi:16S rRNA (guanine(527)-N(7))-methyltransferase RsmG [Pseudoroseomonas globiformis]|uniref:Ribosomal RNA small subunit methyltransferase G n=1 Tax=Teichococcus globiformis TaxID=2307229 RepID=A0ABV7FXM3_9PROT
MKQQPDLVPAQALPVSRETSALLERFIPFFLRWNARINLVAAADAAKIRERHIADSLQLLPLIPHGDAPLIDLGSGGGFPGLVLAMELMRPVHLVEADRRKAAFLQAAAAELGLAHVAVHAARIEQVTLPRASVLTARALAPLEALLPWAERLLTPNGVAIFPKGRNADHEIETARRAGWTMDISRYKSFTDPNATLLSITGIRRAGE